MAIDQDVLLAVRGGEGSSVELSNLDSSAYPDFDCNLTDLAIDKGVPHWFKYFLCGVKGIVETGETVRWKGGKFLVDGSIPPSAGLSSSSALVCSAALAVVTVNRVQASKNMLADTCAKSERYIGTQGGGMDQAIAFHASKGSMINFPHYSS